MEESEKRRERLKAIRLEATATPQSSSSSFSPQTLNSSLSNPLLENPDSNLTTATPPPRFDYYTDPAAAYASDKRRPFTPTPPSFPPSFQGPRNPVMHPVGVPQFQNHYTPHQGTHQGQEPYHSHSIPGPISSPIGIRSPGMSGPIPSPIGIRTPFSNHKGNPNLIHVPGFNNYSNPRSGYGGNPYPVHQGSPNFRSPQGVGQWSNNSLSPSPGHGGGPSPGPGRGRGQWDGSKMSPNSGYSGGRGRGRGNHDAQIRFFYNKHMVEDPWKFMTPVTWKVDKENDVRSFTNKRGPFGGTPSFLHTPLQRTPIAKKPRVPNTSDASNSKQSLAEFLSESFDEAVEDSATV